MMCLKIEDLDKIQKEFSEYYSDLFAMAFPRYKEAMKIKHKIITDIENEKKLEKKLEK
jgi:hypothetical protein